MWSQPLGQMGSDERANGLVNEATKGAPSIANGHASGTGRHPRNQVKRGCELQSHQPVSATRGSIVNAEKVATSNLIKTSS